MLCIKKREELSPEEISIANSITDIQWKINCVKLRMEVHSGGAHKYFFICRHIVRHAQRYFLRHVWVCNGITIPFDRVIVIWTENSRNDRNDATEACTKAHRTERRGVRRTARNLTARPTGNLRLCFSSHFSASFAPSESLRRAKAELRRFCVSMT